MIASGTVRKRKRWSLVLGGALVLALALLLWLQARWLGELAEARRDETRRMLQAAAERIVSDLQSTLAELEEAVVTEGVGFDAAAHPLAGEVIELGPGEQPPAAVPSFVVSALGVQGLDAGGFGQRRLVVLDTVYLEDELLPALARAALGPDGLEAYRVAVVSLAEGVAPLYRSHAEGGHAKTPADVSVDLRFAPNRWRGFLAGGGGSWTQSDEPVFVATGKLDEPGVMQLPAAESASWRLELRHGAGSLEVALTSARRRSFLITGGLLGVLVAGFVLFWVAEQRARRLAERELAFVAGVSHELRTPLSVVRTAASNLERGLVTAPEKVVEYGALIEREATRLGALVERVLRFSGAEDAPRARDAVDVERLIETAIERCSPWRDRKQFEIECRVAPDCGSVQADGEALVALLHNLIENAIKYAGDEPAIGVRARLDESGRNLIVEVADDGPGVARGDRARLFEPFYRAAETRRGGLPGNGLGLGVARDIARAHGGRLELAETPAGRGATFALRLPLDGGEPAS